MNGSQDLILEEFSEILSSQYSGQIQLRFINVVIADNLLLIVMSMQRLKKTTTNKQLTTQHNSFVTLTTSGDTVLVGVQIWVLDHWRAECQVMSNTGTQGFLGSLPFSPVRYFSCSDCRRVISAFQLFRFGFVVSDSQVIILV